MDDACISSKMTGRTGENLYETHSISDTSSGLDTRMTAGGFGLLGRPWRRVIRYRLSPCSSETYPALGSCVT